jgi:hypothetical protein
MNKKAELYFRQKDIFSLSKKNPDWLAKREQKIRGDCAARHSLLHREYTPSLVKQKERLSALFYKMAQFWL